MNHAHVFRFEYIIKALPGIQEGFAIAETWEDAVQIIHDCELTRTEGLRMKQLSVMTEAGQAVIIQGDKK